jgi:ERCC4-type nuclease
MINLIVDFREKGVINELSKISSIENDVDIPINVNGVEFVLKVTNLEVGDFFIKDSEDSLLIERKTYQDLSSSIIDGRFRQQKARLDESIGDASKILFVLEGSNKRKGTLPQSTISSTVINLLFKHNYKVLCTENEVDTFTNLITIIKKMKDKEFHKNTVPVAPIKLISKSKKVADNLMAIQLSAIPGVSFKTALCICEKYKSMKELVAAYMSCIDEDARHDLLRDIAVSDKRKVGVALSKKIYQACYGI